MRPLLRIALVALAFAALCVASGELSFAGGKGRGGGGGPRGGAGHGHGGGKQSAVHRKPTGAPRPAQFGGARDKHGHKPQVTRDTHGHKPQVIRDTKESRQQLTRDTRRPEHAHPHKADRVTSRPNSLAADHPWSKQRANEERKLQHRLDVADRLDKLADANGNEHLHDTAERMRQKAHDHYNKRMSKIDSKSPLDVPDDVETPLPDPEQGLVDAAQRAASEPLAGLPDAAAPAKLTGRENALQRQLLNEERKLTERTGVAERLRALAEEQGDAELLQAADRLEEQALSHFEQRMEAIRNFQERHGLALDN